VHRNAESADPPNLAAGTRLALPVVIGQRRKALQHSTAADETLSSQELAAVLKFMSLPTKERQQILKTAVTPTAVQASQPAATVMSDVEGSTRTNSVQEVPPPTEGDAQGSQRKKARDDPSPPSSDNDTSDSSDTSKSADDKRKNTSSGKKGRKNEDSSDDGEGDGRDWLRRRKKRENIAHSTPKKRRRKSRGRKASSSRSGERTSLHRKTRIKIDRYDGS